MEKEIVYKPSFNFNDYLKINYNLIFKRLTLSIAFIICILIIVANIIIKIIKKSEFIDFFSFPMLIGLIILLIVIIFPYQYTKITLDDPKLKEDITIKINKIGIEYIGESFQNKYNWSDFSKITENKKWYALQLNKRQEIIIQRKDIDTSQQLTLKEIIAFVKK